MDWRWRTGRKLADTLHHAMEFSTAEVKHDRMVGIVVTVGTLGQAFRHSKMQLWGV